MPGDEMIVGLTRTGGVGGFRLVVTVPAAAMERSEVEELDRLLSGMGLCPEAPERPRAADEFHYEITASRGSSTRTVSLYESQVPPSLLPLLSDLVRRAKARR